MNNNKREELIKKAKKRIETVYRSMKEDQKVDIDELIENLTTYEVELEIQNEELKEANERNVKLNRQYSDLYNHAPVGYLILDKKGVIKKINDTALSYLKSMKHADDGNYVIREGYKPFIVYVDYAYHGAFTNHITATVLNKQTARCEVKLWSHGREARDVILESIAYYDDDFEEEMIKTVMIDNTEQKMMEKQIKNQNRQLTELKEELETANEELTDKQVKLSEERRQFLSILDSIPEMIYVSDFDTNEILFGNKKAKDNVGREITGEICYEVLQDKNQVCDFCTNKYIRESEEPYFWNYNNPLLKRDFYVMDRKIRWNDQKEVRFELAVDITERMASENRLKAIVEKSPMVIAVFKGEDYQIDYLNPVFTELLGYTKEDIPTIAEWYQLAYPDPVYREEVKENWGKLIQRELTAKTHGKEIYETIVTCKDGSKKHIEWGYISTGTENWAFGINMTRQRHVEMQLRESEEKYRLIAENLTDVVWILNLTQEKFTYISPSVYTLRGYTPEEAMAQGINESLTPESAKKVYNGISERLPAFLANPEEELLNVYTDELRQTCKDGSIIWIETTTRYQLNKDNEVEVIGVSRNIDERKKYEKSLENRLRYEENIAKFSNTLFLDQPNVINESLSYILKAANCSRVYIFENFIDEQNALSMRQSHEVCAENVEPQIDNPDLQHIVYQQDGFERWEEKLSQNEIINGIVAHLPQREKDILQPQGIKSVLAIPIFVHQEWYGFIGFDDVLKEKEWSDEEIDLLQAAAEVLGMYLENKKNQSIITKANRELQEANATKDKFISILAHDLRSPFNGLLGSCEVLQTGIDDFKKEEVVEFVGYIDISARKIFNLLTNLLEWSRSQRDVIPFDPKPTNLYNLIKETYALVKPSAEVKQVTLEMDVPKGIEAPIDAEMIKTVIRNLLSNAIKFTQEGEKVRITVLQNAQNVVIEVSDNGTGMKEDIKDSLFKIGETKSINGTNGEEGTGFGLLLCKEFVDKHNGTIEVTSELGKGTQIKVVLPLKSI